jgi:hypothetical protein
MGFAGDEAVTFASGRPFPFSETVTYPLCSDERACMPAEHSFDSRTHDLVLTWTRGQTDDLASIPRRSWAELRFLDCTVPSSSGTFTVQALRRSERRPIAVDTFGVTFQATCLHGRHPHRRNLLTPDMMRAIAINFNEERLQLGTRVEYVSATGTARCAPAHPHRCR